MPVIAFIETETITSRLLLLRIDSSISCKDIADELVDQGLAVHEVRRFIKNSSGIPQPTDGSKIIRAFEIIRVKKLLLNAVL